MTRNFSYAGEEFMHYLLSTTLAGGMSLGSGLSASVQTSSPTSSLPSTSTAPVASIPKCITTTTHGAGNTSIVLYIWYLAFIRSFSHNVEVYLFGPVVLLASSCKSARRLREILLFSLQISNSVYHFIEGDPNKALEEGVDLTMGSRCQRWCLTPPAKAPPRSSTPIN